MVRCTLSGAYSCQITGQRRVPAFAVDFWPTEFRFGRVPRVARRLAKRRDAVSGKIKKRGLAAEFAALAVDARRPL